MSLWGTDLCLGEPGEVTAQHLVVVLSSYFHRLISTVSCLCAYGLHSVVAWNIRAQNLQLKTLFLLPSSPFCNCLYLWNTSVQREHQVQQSTHLSLILPSVHKRSTLGRELSYSALDNFALPLLPLIIPRLGTRIVPYGLIL